MSANRSAEEITRQMWGRFDGDNSSQENRHQTIRDARMKEVAEEHKRRSHWGKQAYKTDITDDLGDMGENDSIGG